MRRFFEPASAPAWLKPVLGSIRSALGDVWDVPPRPFQAATADQPPAADHEGGLAYDTTQDRLNYSNGIAWLTLVDTGGAAFTGNVTIGGTLGVTGNAAFSGNVTVAGAALARGAGSVGGASIATGDASHPGYLSIKTTTGGEVGYVGWLSGGALELNSSLGWLVTGATTFANALAVSGDAHFNGGALNYTTAAPDMRLKATGAFGATLRWMHADNSERGVIRFDAGKNFEIEVAGTTRLGITSAGAATFTGALSVTGGLSCTGNATLGDAAGDAHTIIGTSLTLSGNQNATTSLTVSNTDTTNATSRGLLTVTGGACSARIICLHGSIVAIGSNSANDVQLQRNGVVIASLLAGKLDIASGNVLSLAGTQLLTSRRTGWGAPTGTATRTTFATGTVTTAQLAERVKALIDDLTAHGLIGA